MRRLVSLFVVLAAARYAGAATTPAAVAKLVLQDDVASLTEPLTSALADPQPLVRATAARVVAVRDLKPLVAALREAMTRETDNSAAREEICALALIGSADDVAFAAAESAKRPAGVDVALTVAIARRGGEDALSLYNSILRTRPMANRVEFFRTALWGRTQLMAIAGSRLIATDDADGWAALLNVLHGTSLVMPSGLLAASLGSGDEALRYATLFDLLHAWAPDPAKLPELLRAQISEARPEKSSDREDFARELLRRMIGAERKDDVRWQAWLESAEASELIGDENAVLQYLTDAEYAIRHNRCRVESASCAMPEKREAFHRVSLPMQAVAPPAFNLPDVLPGGLVHEIMSDTKCRGEWLGVTTATVDSAGRVQKVPLDVVETSKACRSALDEILHLSFASNTSLASPLTGPVLLVKGGKGDPCLDWAPPEIANSGRLLRTGGAVKAPIPKRRIEPMFPDVARYQMRDAGAGSSLIIFESVITSSGCVRGMQFLGQSPLPAINGAAALALSQWTFVPGYLDGKPVDVIFNLTFNFKLN